MGLQLFNRRGILPQVFLCPDQHDLGPRHVLLDLFVPVGLGIVEGVGAGDTEADEDHVRSGVSHFPQGVVFLLPRSVPQAEFIAVKIKNLYSMYKEPRNFKPMVRNV